MNVEETNTAREMREYEKQLQDIPVLSRELHNLECKKNFLQKVFHNVADQDEGVIKVQCQGQVYYLWIKQQYEYGGLEVEDMEVYPFDPIRN